MKSFAHLSSARRNLGRMAALLSAGLLLGAGCVGEPDATQDLEHEGEALSGLLAATHRGYDTATGQVRPTAVTQGFKTTTGGSSTVSYQVAASAAELAEAMSLSATLSVDFGFFGGFNKTWGYANSLNTTQYSVEVVAYARHVEGTTTFTNVHLTADAQKVLDQQGPGAFVKKYGDAYINQVTTGGELIGTYIFYAQTASERGAVQDGLSDILQQYAGNPAELQAHLNGFAQSRGIPTEFRSMVTGVTGLTVDRDNFIARAESFASHQLNAPVVLDISTLPYDTIPAFGKLPPAVVLNRAYVTDPSPQGPGAMMVALDGIREQIDRMKEIYQFYDWHDDDKALSAARAQVVADFTTLKKQMIGFNTNPTALLTQYRPQSFKSLAKGAPSLHVVSGQSNGYGGTSGGQPFTDVPYKNPVSFIANKERLFSIRLTDSGSAVSRISLGYAGESPHNYGGGSGTTHALFTLPKGTFITSVAVGADSLVRYLKFTADDGSHVAAGSPSSAVKVVKIPDNSVLSGFSGRAGSNLNSLQVHWITFRSTTWSPVTL